MIGRRWTKLLWPVVVGLGSLDFVMLVRILPQEWRQALAGASTLGVVALTGVLVWVTWLYVERADRQRRAIIRPVIVFRDDFAPIRRLPNREGRAQFVRALLSQGKRIDEVQLAAKVAGRSAVLVNDGMGVALNVHAWYTDEHGPHDFAHAASIASGGSHFTEAWYADLILGEPKEFWVRYEDAEGTRYRGHCVYAVVDGRRIEKWDRPEEGEGPAPPQGDPYWD